MLDGAAPLQGGTGVDKSVAVDGKRPAAGRIAGDRWWSTAQRASEGLHVGGVRALAIPQLGGCDSGVDLGDSGVCYEEVLAEDTACGIVGIVTGVALGSGVVQLLRG